MLKMLSRRKTHLVLLLFLIGLIGCSKPIVLHPITGADIFEVPVGTDIGETQTTKPGWFFSNYYVEQVMKIKIDNP